MKNREVIKEVRGIQTEDGAGVKLTRVLHRDTIQSFDPFLMLDSFDSTNYEDFCRGFPQHPHRGIETISLLKEGAMTHKDTLGNEDTITSGEVQWMTAGSGILHSEMLPEVPRMLGLQVWLNMSAKNKMAKPDYKAIRKEEIEEVETNYGSHRLLIGEFDSHKGFKSEYHPLNIIEFNLKKDKEVTFKTSLETGFIFTLLGDVEVEGKEIKEKTAALLGEGDTVTLKARTDAVVLFFESEPHHEPVSWGGPIVMNTDEEIREAFNELRAGAFIKEQAEYREE